MAHNEQWYLVMNANRISIQVNYNRNGSRMTTCAQPHNVLRVAADLAAKGCNVGHIVVYKYPKGKGKAKELARWTNGNCSYYGTGSV